MGRLTLLRHAAPPAAYHGRYIGHTDIGIDPSLFDHSKIESLISQRFDRIYSSDLLRCTATLRQMGLESFITDPRLREVRFKPMVEGKNFSQIESMEDFDPASLESQESWHRAVCDEPIEAFRGRVQSFLDELPSDKEILLCSHAGTIAMILSILEPERPYQPCNYLDHIQLYTPIG